MDTEAPETNAPDAPDATGINVDLNIISPNATVLLRPLTFELPSNTSIRAVKRRIRQKLPMRPTDDQQRLIYKGRSLENEDQTLEQVIGIDTIKEDARQTFHLVLRGIIEPTPSAVRGRSPATSDPRSVLNNIQARSQSPHHHLFGSAPPTGAARRTPSNQPGFSGFAVPSAPNFTPQQTQQMQAQLQQAQQQMQAQIQAQMQGIPGWPPGLQREAVNRAMANHQINQNQSARAAMGLHGVGDTGAAPGLNVVDTGRGRVSPGLHPYTRTTIRDGYAEGQPYRVTNTETWTPLTTGDVQNILRGADAGQATQAMTNAMQRSDSPSPFGPPPPVSSTPFYPTMGSRAGSRMGTPDPASRSVSGGSTQIASHPQQLRATPPSAPEVYILSSPQGPRAVLINNNSDTYYTPVTRLSTGQAPSLISRIRPPAPMPWQAAVPLVQQTGAAHAQHVTGQPQAAGPAQPPVAQAPPPPADGAAPAAIPGHPNNQIVAAGIAQLWQHLWLLVRLGFFVWWLTYSNSSWARWFTVIAVAVTIFLVNTGVLNGLYDQVAGPVRRHVDHLLPLPRLQNQAAAQPQAAQPQAQTNVPAVAPVPAQAAARLIAQRRRDNATWLMNFARRLERAGLLFLASIAPGVAERHIAHLEAEERAARRQREEAEAAAAAAAAEAAAQEAAEGGQEATTETTEMTEDGHDGHDGQAGGDGASAQQDGPAEGAPAANAPEPLVAF
ncbi:hypothetical protein F5X68DRAFT_265240 [Plectosphaerella plurivora]|uniref:Ubiquitin-like domain-containing protein n=1 Tax=Plectosphaerella plurivora TaxID=936078 RepID=A0A9P8V3M1_9PEZI|nr:hypothetical protein F5X68DRAFT_265240 [Plectosphaerella plurivora]